MSEAGTAFVDKPVDIEVPTVRLRFERRRSCADGPNPYRYVLQQVFEVSTYTGEHLTAIRQEWRDVPVVEEGTP